MNSTSFKIIMDWSKPFSPCESEEEITLGDMSIIADEINLTRNVSTVIDSLRESIRVAAFPAALWFTTYWWRILHEPTPSGEQFNLSYNWKNAHELASANNGYAWPAIRFIPDGKFMTVSSFPQYHSDKEPVYYTGVKEDIIVENTVFREALQSFITTTLNRLDEKEFGDSNLHSLWEQLSNEIADEDFSLYRRIEAILGYDADEAPEKIIEKLEALLRSTNERTLTELSTICSINETETPIKELDSACEMSRSGLKGQWSNIKLFPDANWNNGLHPWDAGRLLAKKLRNHIGNSEKEIDNTTLCNFLGILPKQAFEKEPSHDYFSLSHTEDDKLFINFKRESSNYYAIGRRFQLARLISSLLSAQTEDNWFISSSCKTYIQKMQRAFAAEFLAPIDEVKKIIDKNVTSETIEKAASYFLVSPQTIAHSLVNQGIIKKASLLELYF